MSQLRTNINRLYNTYAQKRIRCTIDDLRVAKMVAWPLTRLDICVTSDGAAVTILASEEGIKKLEIAGAQIVHPLVKVTGSLWVLE